jgi:uncharacterized protein YbbK (DUF523 family)
MSNVESVWHLEHRTLNVDTRRPLRIGISSCLLGDEVRFDGGHKRDPLVIDLFGPHVEWIRVCPEVEVGMGVPREPVHLVRGAGGVRMITVNTKVDYTDTMREWAARRAAALATLDLDGYVLKKDSPSCGMRGVKLYDAETGAWSREGIGLFASALMAASPQLAIEDEGRLADPVIRTRFLERVMTRHRHRIGQ